MTCLNQIYQDVMDSEQGFPHCVVGPPHICLDVMTDIIQAMWIN